MADIVGRGQVRLLLPYVQERVVLLSSSFPTSPAYPPWRPAFPTFRNDTSSQARYWRNASARIVVCASGGGCSPHSSQGATSVIVSSFLLCRACPHRHESQRPYILNRRTIEPKASCEEPLHEPTEGLGRSSSPEARNRAGPSSPLQARRR